jgi:ribonuclease D
VLTEVAAAHSLPTENLLAPDVVRRLSWTPPEPADADTVAAYLRAAGARSWQIELTTAGLVEAMAATVDEPADLPEDGDDPEPAVPDEP